jgi:prepilin-type N-terminal cleavage/methylation domain-containing protein
VSNYSISGERQGGMSLIEMVVATGIISILSSVALPSFFELMNHAAIRSERLALIQDIRVTRFKAISHRRPAYLCALNTTGSCARRARWNQGWMAYIDNNLDSVYDDGDEQFIYHVNPVENNNGDIIFHARWQDIKFDSRGVLRRSGHFRVCNPEISGEQNMQVIRMNTYGRLAIETDELPCE